MNLQPGQEVISTAAIHDGPIETDAVIVGAGPVGLFQVFELGLLEIKAHVIDSLAYPGGQPVELYPDKPIYDIPAMPVCTGQELTDALLKQIEPFGATFHLGQTVARFKSRTMAALRCRPRAARAFLTRTVFIAAGVGAFEPRSSRSTAWRSSTAPSSSTGSGIQPTLPAATWSSWAAATPRWTGP
jgi:thioredoxin reductase (NADPH)